MMNTDVAAWNAGGSSARESGEAWVPLAGRSDTPVNPFFDEASRFAFHSGEPLGGTPNDSAHIWSVEHILRGPEADLPSY